MHFWQRSATALPRTAERPAAAGAEQTASPDSRWSIRVRDLHKAFGAQQVLRGVDLDVEGGRINVIVGGSGEGKTVLLKHLIALLKPDRGQIWVEGEDIMTMTEKQLRTVRGKFGMVFQHAALFDSMTVAENLAFPLVERYRLPRREILERVRQMLARLGIEGTERQFPGQLSGGQRKRVGVGRALMDRPRILLYDEPTTGLDPVATKSVDDLILSTARQFGVTSVVISHDMPSVLRIGDRIALLRRGEIVVSGEKDELLAAPPPELREFLAPSRVLEDRERPRAPAGREVEGVAHPRVRSRRGSPRLPIMNRH